MYRGLKYTFIFSIGAAVGSLITWRLLDTHYQQILKEEEETIKEFYRGKAEESHDEMEQEADVYEEKAEEAKQILVENNYTSEENIKKEDELMEPYVITYEEYGEIDGYDTDNLTYYEDGVLTNDMDESIDNIDDIVGIDSLGHFDENEDDPDTIYVRNDRLRIDYEISRDYRKYKDVVRRPYTPEEE